ncbi:uncharacterized protein LTR77_001152 [Saxophila tyrrhenica]|uniref:Uncharacterized protein n=1 Tax=Saxophila tyrrhenica TaxID=1690608 RepID=A0AAV9PP71_9PEZI|nr:hypothetical protein LTR77_001152 [Saxophila tyrrhenica]
MATSQSSQLIILNDFVTLPIIISDYDAPTETKRRASSTATTTTAHSRQNSAASTNDSATTAADPSQQQWSTGFTSFTDELWDRMTVNMKQRLRQACVEVLKRTDDTNSWIES